MKKTELQQTEATVELEGGIENMIANAMKSSETAQDSTPSMAKNEKDMSMGEDLSPAESSIEMTFQHSYN